MTATPYIKKITPEYIENREKAKQLFKNISLKILNKKIWNKKLITQIALCWFIWMKQSKMSNLINRSGKLNIFYPYSIQKETSIKFIIKLEEFAKEKQLIDVLEYIKTIKTENSSLFAL